MDNLRALSYYYGQRLAARIPVHAARQARISAMSCGYYRTSRPVTVLPMIMRGISDAPSKIVKILASL
jgi:hypothetical protein